jgi:chemotaxis protein MotB
MKLDEGFAYQKLSLDITPLIDIIFLLVLFFAVSTSFISAEDLNALKDNILNLSSEKQTLNTEVKERAQAVARLESQLSAANAEGQKLASLAAVLEQQRFSLQKSLDDTVRERRTLGEQLERAMREYESLNLQVAGLKSDHDKQAEQEQLLRALLLERAREKDQLQGQLAETLAQRDLALDEQADQKAKARMLEALLAEKAAKYEDVEIQLTRAREQNDALESKLFDLESNNKDREQDVSQMRIEILRLQSELGKYKEVAALDRQQVQRILEAQENLRAGLDSYLKDNKLGIKREKQKLVLQLSDQILFDSGSAVIKPEGVEILRAVGEIIKARLGNLEVQIGGHTDNIPIAAGRRAFATNWALSAARAVNVVQFLEEEVDIDAARMSAVGYGEHRPIAGNDTPEGRALNRRIEIVLVPR